MTPIICQSVYENGGKQVSSDYIWKQIWIILENKYICS